MYLSVPPVCVHVGSSPPPVRYDLVCVTSQGNHRDGREGDFQNEALRHRGTQESQERGPGRVRSYPPGDPQVGTDIVSRGPYDRPRKHVSNFDSMY